MAIADNFQILPAVTAVDDPVAAPVIPGGGSAFVNFPAGSSICLLETHICFGLPEFGLECILIYLFKVPKVKTFLFIRKKGVIFLNRAICKSPQLCDRFRNFIIFSSRLQMLNIFAQQDKNNKKTLKNMRWCAIWQAFNELKNNELNQKEKKKWD